MLGDYDSQCDSAVFATAGAVFRVASGVFAVTPAVTGAFVVSAANEKCVRVDGLVKFQFDSLRHSLGFRRTQDFP